MLCIQIFKLYSDNKNSNNQTVAFFATLKSNVHILHAALPSVFPTKVTISKDYLSLLKIYEGL